MTDIMLLTQRGRVTVEIHGNGAEYEGLDGVYKQNFRGGVTEYPTKPSIQELLLASMKTLPIKTENDFEVEFRQTLQDWKNQREGYHLSNQDNWRVKPDIYTGMGSNIADTLYRHLLEDNPSEFRKINIYLPSNYASPPDYAKWPWLNVNLSYWESKYGFAYGHHIGRCQYDRYLLISSCSLQR